MSWRDDLETVVAQTRNERFRELTADDHPDREIWRRRMTETAGRDPGPAPMPAPVESYPPLAEQAVNLWRSLRGFVKSGLKLAPKAVRAERQAVCEPCEHYDAIAKRCRVCGCLGKAKVYIASDRCPLEPPKWDAHV